MNNLIAQFAFIGRIYAIRCALHYDLSDLPWSENKLYGAAGRLWRSVSRTLHTPRASWPTIASRIFHAALAIFAFGSTRQLQVMDEAVATRTWLDCTLGRFTTSHLSWK